MVWHGQEQEVWYPERFVGGKLMLSRVMDCRLLTTAGEFVQYDYGYGGQSTVPMHGKEQTEQLSSLILMMTAGTTQAIHRK